MTTLRQLRKAALAPEGTIEAATGDGVAFSAAGRVFADAAGGSVRLILPEEARDRLVAELGAQPITMDGRPAAAIALAEINGMALNYWVHQAWLATQPAGQPVPEVKPGDVGDLPKALGAPATRALAGAGITSLAAAAEHSEPELLALHGVGPRAIRVLTEHVTLRRD